MKRRLFIFAKRFGIGLGIFLGIVLLLLAGLLVFLGTETGLNTAVNLATRFTDNRFTLDKASGSLYSKATLQGLRYTDTGLELSIDEIALNWKASQLWRRHLSIEEIHFAGLRLFVAPSKEAPPPSDEALVIPAIDLPIHISLGRVLVDDFSFFSKQDATDPDFHLKEGLVKNLTFQDQQLNIEMIRLENKEISAQAQVKAQTIGDYPLQFDLKYHYAMEDMSPFSGQAKVTGSLSDLQLENELQTPLTLRLQAQALNVLEDPHWTLHLEGNADLAKIKADLPDMRITNMLITGQGTSEEYSLNLQLNALAKELGQEPLQLTSALQGNLSSLTLQSLQLLHSQASLAAQGNLAWDPLLSWQMQIKAAHLDPSFLLAEWPADINLELQSKGQIQGEGLEGVQAELLLANLAGNLRGFPLQGAGTINLQKGQAHIPDFIVRCADSSLRLQGDYAEKADIRFTLEAPNLQALLPDIKGRISGKGQFKGTPEQLDVTLYVQANNLEMAEMNVLTLRLDANGEISTQRFPQLHVQAEGLQFGETLVDTVALRLDGSVADNRLNLNAKNKDIDLHIGLQGKADMEKMAWNGRIYDTRIELPQVGILQQKQPTALQLSATEAKLAPFCLVMEKDSLCMNASWAEDIWRVETKVDQLDLAILEKFPDIVLPPVIKKYGGAVVADLNATGKAAELQQASVDVSVKDLYLLVAPEEEGSTEHRLQWDTNQLQLNYANNTLSASLHSNLQQAASIKMNVQLSEVDPAQADQFLQAPVKGQIQLNVQDFTLINLLSEQMVTIDGQLKGDVRVSNTLAAPMINGQIGLGDGKLDLTPLGLVLSPLSLQMQSDAKGLHIQALAKSGEGEIQINSTLRLQELNLNTATVSVKGESFQAMNLPELSLVISPDLEVIFNKERMDVHGKVTVPSAHISSTIDMSNAVTASDDVVVIDDEEAEATGPTLPLYLRVKAILGDDVRIDAYGLRGRIIGNLEVFGEPGRPLLGNGTLRVEDGTFTFMGQRLGLDLSRLMFTGGPLTNPGVDLRIQTDDGKVKAGLTVQGTLRRQEINLYSTPTMDQFAILRHLLESSAVGGETRDDVGVIGDVADKVGMGGAVPYLQALKKFSMIDEIRLDTDDGFDSASLVFGSWVTSDFYISYGKSLLDDTSTFNTRYTIGKGFFFTTNTSPTASGGDIKYELER